MIAYLKLIRWQNLLIIVLTQFLMRYAIIEPIAGMLDVTLLADGTTIPLSLQLPFVDFIILVLSTVTIAAGGYVINDYFDIRTDLINRGDIIVGKRISRRRAMMLHNLLNIAGVLAGFYVSYRVGFLWLGIIFLLVSGLLYFYSSTYKRMLLVGNIIVALLIAVVPFMVLAFEIPMIYSYYTPLTTGMPSLSILGYWVGGFSLFAFITTLAREVIKDMEDFEGDRAYGSNSLPVAAGIGFSKVFVVTIQTVTLVLILIAWVKFLNDYYTMVYMVIAIIVPLLISIYYVLTKSGPSGFHRGSLFMKIVMLGGILYSVLAWLIIEKGLLA